MAFSLSNIPGRGGWILGALSRLTRAQGASHRDEAAVALALDILWHSYGLPYVWGGDDPMAGYDCSGVYVEILKSVGKLPHEGDWNAQSLFRLFPKVEGPAPGAGVFFGAGPATITHVGICIDGRFMFEAGGGGRKVRSLADAIRNNAFLKIRPIHRRIDLVGYADPFLIP